ncbi:hypothetical protein [Mycolicibacterium mucogenicum]|uniref:Uncharacterized protein n=1 Tax=Mycolicibacterium mucogenicum DSM 44124 TaxID=1226753 RepID=A0A8H2JBN5_MYCMU|nr:hypothetical protein [Mycolicibacterium mucogenicum]KAB7758426.1 hypothetical protein MMUC44124_13215 [Mycolicibacterium mucogenicum DSM 44124]QPG71578.1 hypothetical protein C1S78_011940 [Mycolicibacterium mucogenicum DSM 44124]
MGVTTNKVLCDSEIAPDGSVVVIEDVGAGGVSGVYVHPDVRGDGGVVRALWVHTMNVHECDLVGRMVRVRVYSGTETRGMGVPAFDGHLDIATGVLAVGDRHNRNRQLLFGTPKVVRVTVFLGNEIETVQFGDSDSRYPLSGPSEINVLLHGETDFVHALGYPMPRWGGLRRLRRRSRNLVRRTHVDVQQPATTRRAPEEREPALPGVAP